MAKKLTKTSTPGIYRRHVNGCPNSDGKKRCTCPYAVPTRHRGKQSMETYRTFEEARAAKGRKDAGDSRPKSKLKFGEYFEGEGKDETEGWIGTYSGRTKRGFEEETRIEYRRSIQNEAMRVWADRLMADIDQRDVRELYAGMVRAGKTYAAMRKLRAALSPLFNTAIEDGIVTVNPVTAVKIPAPPKTELEGDEDEERGKALRRDELAAFLMTVDQDWRMFFEFLVVTGLRIGEATGLVWENVVLTGEEPRVRVREQIYEGRRKRYLKSDAGKRDIPLTPVWVARLMGHRRDTFQGPKSPVFASVTGTPIRPSNVYRRVLAPAAIDAGLYIQVGPDVDNADLRPVVMGRSGRRHLAEPTAEAALCGRGGEMSDAGDGPSTSACQICQEAARKRSRQGRRTAIAFHAFRHTCASLLFAEGRNVKQVSEWLGHTDPAFTLKVYIHLLDDGLGAGLDLPIVAPDSAGPLHGVDLSVDLAELQAA